MTESKAGEQATDRQVKLVVDVERSSVELTNSAAFARCVSEWAEVMPELLSGAASDIIVMMIVRCWICE